VALFRENQIPFEALNPLMMITRRFERVSDQARNICMEVLYVCTGEPAKHPGSEVFRVLFVDEHNSCRSQMAEAIANTMGFDKFHFASAGLEPRPLDQATVAFMKEKGCDISRMVSKSINQVPNLDHYHVIVALAKEARRAFPQAARKLVFLDWPITDPSEAQASETEKRAAYESTYEYLQEHIQDLAAAILGDSKTNLANKTH
jgi:arsenate reductase